MFEGQEKEPHSFEEACFGCCRKQCIPETRVFAGSRSRSLVRHGPEMTPMDQEFLPIRHADLLEDVCHVMPDRAVAY